MLVTVAVLAITLSLALPSFSNMLARSRLKSAAEQLRADLVFARTEAQKRNQTIVVSFDRDDDGSWCYGMRFGGACDCRETNAADADYCFLDVNASNVRIGKSVAGATFSGITMDALAFGGSLSFSPVRPTLATGRASLSSASETVRIVSSGVGRMRVCSPEGDNFLNHYPEC
ncbi:MAG: GspH/FimT family pseudopilin [Gammaproteobacteria bacterium]|nr:GspH/FimT family pseudopilin [Gammaproteobacteria bacterium]